MRIVVSGGGTAGHISPTLATSDALKSLDKSVELLYIGQAGSMEAKIVAARGMKFAAIRAGKFRRDHFANSVSKVANLSTLGPNARDALRTLVGVTDSLKVLRRYRPRVVFLKGGFVCVPVGLAAAMLRIPYVVHESDVTPGLANKILARWAAKIAVGFPERNYPDFDHERLVFVGNPVRQEILAAKREDGLKHFELSGELPVVLITGGSQGAAQINNAVLGALPELTEHFQVIHQAGEGELERLKFELSRRPALAHPEHYTVFAFITRMELALAAADVVVGRAGVSTIVESAALGKPIVLIPNMSMAGHQVENARLLSRAGAARVLNSDRLTPAMLVGELKRLVGDREEQGRLGRAIRQFARPDAATALAQVILDAGRAGERGVAEQDPNTEDDA